MTNDEAKAHLLQVRAESTRAQQQALDIALWLLERESLAEPVIRFATADWDTDSNVTAYLKARQTLHAWLREHPRPGS